MHFMLLHNYLSREPIRITLNASTWHKINPTAFSNGPLSLGFPPASHCMNGCTLSPTIKADLVPKI